MIMYGGGAGQDGRSINHISEGGGGGLVLKKGPWTAAEDEMLAAYVRENGEGNWNALQKNTGLARCGKSCRLRWANHLRPNLRKGSFTSEEEHLIIQLHAQLGNKWARMAAQLPGRTDNEIKNYWNTRLKRLQRQGLPLYPSDIIPNHQLQPHPHSHHQQQMYIQPQSSQTSTPSSSSFTFHTTNASTANLLHPLSPHTPNTPPQPPFSSPLSSPRNNQYPTLPLFALPNSQTNNNNNNTNFTFPIPPPSSLFAKCDYNAYSCINRVSTAPFSPVSRDSYSSFLTLPYSSPNPTSTSSPSFLHSPYTPNYCSTFFHTNTSYSMKQELPSNQTLRIGAFNNVNNFTDNEKQNSIGFHRRSISCNLLEDVLQEAEALADGGGGRPPKRRQRTASLPNNNDDFFSISFGQYDSSENICSLQDLKSKEEESLQMNAMQEDITKLFDWESNSGEILNVHSSVVTDDNHVLDVHQFASLFPVDSTAVATAANDEQNNDNNCLWDSLHEIR